MIDYLKIQLIAFAEQHPEIENMSFDEKLKLFEKWRKENNVPEVEIIK